MPSILTKPLPIASTVVLSDPPVSAALNATASIPVGVHVVSTNIPNPVLAVMLDFRTGLFCLLNSAIVALYYCSLSSSLYCSCGLRNTYFSDSGLFESYCSLLYVSVASACPGRFRPPSHVARFRSYFLLRTACHLLA
ncbi:hypothetical protein TRVL_10278 [Trypanosoma vivax]|nr:hypothetical protein TRVL_10278 [Trypanosoma vivax]